MNHSAVYYTCIVAGYEPGLVQADQERLLHYFYSISTRLLLVPALLRCLETITLAPTRKTTLFNPTVYSSYKTRPTTPNSLIE